MKTTSCTGNIHFAFQKAPRCGAKTKRNNGMPCRAPAIRGKSRCRMHGGSKGSGGQRGNTNALKHGFTTIKTKIFKQSIKRFMQHSRALLKL